MYANHFSFRFLHNWNRLGTPGDAYNLVVKIAMDAYSLWCCNCTALFGGITNQVCMYKVFPQLKMYIAHREYCQEKPTDLFSL